MKIEGDTITFSSGRTASANCGIIGLSPKGESGWSITEGYDSDFWHDERTNSPLTSDDLLELADFMIGLWTEFRNDLKSP